MRKINPGPLASTNFPRRKITPRSYSRKIRIIWGRMITARMKIGITQATNFNSPSSNGMAYPFFGFTFR
ncbi:MAG TPA: hypothetical protein VNN16_09160, partial [Candidatus Sulfotelmatobacter sp.]|nr:hypothetical protein [Candidatus Sulfotelmatobacter sp.]